MHIVAAYAIRNIAGRCAWSDATILMACCGIRARTTGLATTTIFTTNFAGTIGYACTIARIDLASLRFGAGPVGTNAHTIGIASAAGAGAFTTKVGVANTIARAVGPGTCAGETRTVSAGTAGLAVIFETGSCGALAARITFVLLTTGVIDTVASRAFAILSAAFADGLAADSAAVVTVLARIASRLGAAKAGSGVIDSCANAVRGSTIVRIRADRT